jgi:hypothetical protein
MNEFDPRPPGTPDPDWVDPEKAIANQDTFRKVYLGEISDPIFPPHPAPPEVQEDELTRAALADLDAECHPKSNARPTVWRLVFLIILAVAALAYIFGMRL